MFNTPICMFRAFLIVGGSNVDFRPRGIKFGPFPKMQNRQVLRWTRYKKQISNSNSSILIRRFVVPVQIHSSFPYEYKNSPTTIFIGNCSPWEILGWNTVHVIGCATPFSRVQRKGITSVLPDAVLQNESWAPSWSQLIVETLHEKSYSKAFMNIDMDHFHCMHNGYRTHIVHT